MNIIIEGGLSLPSAFGHILTCPRCKHPVRYVTLWANQRLGIDLRMILAELSMEMPIDEMLVPWLRHDCKRKV